MSFQIEEVNGKLCKIVEKKIDEFNVKRTAIPLTEVEYENLVGMLEKKQKDDMALLTRHKGKLLKKRAVEVGEPELEDTEEGDEVASDLTPNRPVQKRFTVKKKESEERA